MPIVGIKELGTHIGGRARLLGIDHGEKTLGLAIGTPELSMVTPFKTLIRKTLTENIKELSIICREYGIKVFVIGLPLNMDGTEGPRAQSVRHFGANLLKNVPALGFEPVIAFYDERLSTFAAEDLLIEDLNMHRDKRKSVIDAQAAAEILKRAMEAMRA